MDKEIPEVTHTSKDIKEAHNSIAHSNTHTGGHAEHHVINYGVHILVWIGLIGLTAITVSIAGINLGSLTLTAALIIATLKTMLVVNFFMHIKFDNKVFKIFIGICMITFIIMLIFTFFDLTFRDPLI
jgi:cytochrome c oxidase subunit 4